MVNKLYKRKDASDLKLIGGVLCLDFLNTIHGYGNTDPEEYLNTYQDLIDWSRHAGITDNHEAKALSRRAVRQPAEAKITHKRAIKLREAIFCVFTKNLGKKSHDRKHLAVFNSYLTAAMTRSRIMKTNDGFIWDMAGDRSALDWFLNPVVRSAAELLISEKFKRIKKCADPICGWLFLDKSRNRSRRWCDMRGCGNRAKASRFYKKKKSSRHRTIPARKKPLRSTPAPGLDRHLL